jgi:hypothetical protein
MIDLLKLIGNLVVEDDFKKKYRLHQGWWRTFVLGENQGRHPLDSKKNICSSLINGEQTKNNFLSATVKNVVEEVLKKRKNNNIDFGKINENRLYNNLLSSQPLCFNFFASFYFDKKLALNFIRKFYPNVTSINEVHFEFANIENKFDKSAFDIAFDVNDGSKRGIIGFECKYTDTFSPKKIDKQAYKKLYDKSEIFETNRYHDLIEPKFNQLFRNQLVGESFKWNNLTKYDFAYFGLFCHYEDESAISIGEEYKLFLKNIYRHCFQIITYKDFFEQISKLELTWQYREYFMLLWARYCGLKLSNSAYRQLKDKEKECMRVYDIDENDLTHKRMIASIEGGVIYTARKGNDLFLIIDETTLSDFLNEDDKQEIGSFVSIYKFENDEKRKDFINKYKIRIKN